MIGYENRLLNKEDFNDDKKDAGELGSGHTVTALYELIPTGIKDTMLKDVDALRYQKTKSSPKNSFTDEVMNIKLRYKKPDGDKSILIEHPLKDENIASIQLQIIFVLLHLLQNLECYCAILNIKAMQIFHL